MARPICYTALLQVLCCRSQALELRCGQFEERLSKQRLEDDEVINALRTKIIDLESELSTVRRRTEVAMYDISDQGDVSVFSSKL